MTAGMAEMTNEGTAAIDNHPYTAPVNITTTFSSFACPILSQALIQTAVITITAFLHLYE